MGRRGWIPLLLLAAGLAGIGLGRVLLAPQPAPEPAIVLESGTWLAPPRPLPAFELVDQDGNPAGPEALRGRWTFVFFGFTHCPEACPMTLAMLGNARRELSATLPATELPAVLLVSVDPERDTPAVLKAHLAGFGPGFTGLTGDAEAVRSFATALGVPYRKIPMDGDYMIDHSTAIMVVNPRVGVAGLLSAPHDTGRIVRDFRRLLAGS